MLKLSGYVSDTLCNVLDKLCTTLGARKNFSPDGELTDRNVIFILTLDRKGTHE